VIRLELHDPLHIRIDTEDRSILMGLKEHFSAMVPGARFMPQYGIGGWDGKVCMFNSGSRTLPYGLLTDFLRYMKKEYPLEELGISPDIASLFKCIEDPKITAELALTPRPYQLDCITTALRYGRGLIKSSVASGKSLIMAYILSELFHAKKIKKALIIVPTTNLCVQLESDFIEYGLGLPVDVIYSGSETSSKVCVTFGDGSKKLYNRNDVVESKRGKILAKELTSTDEIL